MSQPYVHGYTPTESRRLNDQAQTLADLLHGGISYPPGATVLEAGCGTGAQTLELARRHAGTWFTSVDISAASLATARRRVDGEGLANVTFREGDLADPPFAPASFDHLFVCFVLEHLPRPDDTLRTLTRLVRPGGTVTVIEGDHGTVCLHPEDPDARAAIACQVDLQRRAGGDPCIGRRLHPMLTAAGLGSVRVQPRLVYADGSRPDLQDAFTRRTFTAMVDGVRAAALAAHLTVPARFDAGVRALLRTAAPDGTFCYTFFRATAVVP